MATSRACLCYSLFAVWMIVCLPTGIVIAQTTPEQSIHNALIDDRTRGKELYNTGKSVEAAKIFRALVAQNKSDHESWYYLGLSLLKQPDKLKDSTKAFEAAHKLQPGFAQAAVGLAYSYLLRYKLADAYNYAVEASRLDPSIAQAHYIAGFVRLSRGDPEEALQKANDAIRLKSDLAAAHLLKSQALLAIYTRQAHKRRPPRTSGLLSPEETAERRKSREETRVLFHQVAEGLENYLRLGPADTSTDFWREQLETIKVYGYYRDKRDKPLGEPIRSGSEIMHKARVLSKPGPDYPDSAKAAGVTGTVVLRAVFAADGTVRHILVLNGLPYGLTEAAIRAARAIKFVPATIDGRAVHMYIQLEYNFHLY